MDGNKPKNIKPPKYLFFTLETSVFATRLSDINEVVNDLEVGDIPLKNNFAVGMSSLRGEIISLLSLKKILATELNSSDSLFKLESAVNDTSEKSKLITLIINHKQMNFGLLIDKIIQVGVLSSENYKESKECKWIPGHYNVDGRIATILSLKSLMDTQCP